MAVEDIFPEGVKAAGQTRWLVTSAFPGTPPDTVSLAALANAVDVACYIGADSQEITLEQEQDEDTRACDSSKRYAWANPEFKKDMIVHVVDPQKPGTEKGNLARGAIPANATIYMTLYMGPKDRNSTEGELKPGDLVDVYQVTTGAELVSPRESGKYRREVRTSFTRVLHGVTLKD